MNCQNHDQILHLIWLIFFLHWEFYIFIYNTLCIIYLHIGISPQCFILFVLVFLGTFAKCIKESYRNINISVLMMLNHRAKTIPKNSLSFPLQFRGKAFVLSPWLLWVLLTYDLSPFLRLPLLIQRANTTLINLCIQSVVVTLYKPGYHLLIGPSLQSKVSMLPLLVSQQGPGQSAWEPWNIC